MDRQDTKMAERGLSPRVRGNLWLNRVGVVAGGSIPACAGEPQVTYTILLFRRVYPRVCGGTAVTGTPMADTWGLSPRVRGNRG